MTKQIFGKYTSKKRIIRCSGDDKGKIRGLKKRGLAKPERMRSNRRE
jgi:hypothetical protein